MPIHKTGLFAIRYQRNQLIILDQTELPDKISYLKLQNYREVILAIKQLKIRGAPLIGAAAAYGLALESTRKSSNLRNHLKKAAHELKLSRPTAVNLSWAIDRMLAIINNNKIANNKLSTSLIAEAVKIEKQEQANSNKIGQIGAALIKDNMTIMTICNTGWLAAPGIGTALGIIYTAHKQGKRIKVFVLETRPLLQGARLTAIELEQAKIPYTIITDNMMGTFMRNTDIVLTGADRIVRNGDTANKIGTLTLAITSHYYEVPFYVVAPTSSVDLNKKTGKDIVIEERDKNEVLYVRKQLIAPKHANACNPAFDITPNNLITGIITEKGILKSPFYKSLSRL